MSLYKPGQVSSRLGVSRVPSLSARSTRLGLTASSARWYQLKISPCHRDEADVPAVSSAGGGCASLYPCSCSLHRGIHHKPCQQQRRKSPQPAQAPRRKSRRRRSCHSSAHWRMTTSSKSSARMVSCLHGDGAYGCTSLGYTSYPTPYWQYLHYPCADAVAVVAAVPA